MKSIEERLDALVAKAKQEERTRLELKEKAINEVLECCLDTLEKADDISKKGVIVIVPTCLIKNVPEWKDRIMMGASLQEYFQHKVIVTLIEQTEEQKRDSWYFQLNINSMP